MTHVTIQRSVMETMLEVLQWSKPHNDAVITHGEAITAIKQALSAPVQEPVATLLQQSKGNFERNFGSNGYADWIYKDLAELLDTPPAAQPSQRPWVGLVNKDNVLDFGDAHVTTEFARGALWAEAKLKELNK
jgi:hypothetical protein